MSVTATHDWTPGDFIRAIWLNAITAAALASAWQRIRIGGSRETPLATTGWVRAWEYDPYKVPADDALYDGYVHTLVIELKVSDASAVMRARLVRTDTSAVIWTSDDSSATAWEEQRETWTPIAGVPYAVDFQKDNDEFGAWGVAYVERLVRELTS